MAIGYVPSGEVMIAVVVSEADPVSADVCVSPFTKPTAEYVSTGFIWPNALILLSAVAVSPALFTRRFWVTGAAAAKVEFPAWLAVIMTDPAPMMVRVEPESVAGPLT